MSYGDFQKYLDKHHKKVNFVRDIQPQINKLSADCFRSVFGKIDMKRRINTFEIFGLDFMLDDDFKVYLIEVNTNPCLQTSESPLLSRLVPAMVDNTFRLVIDPLFPPPAAY